MICRCIHISSTLFRGLLISTVSMLLVILVFCSCDNIADAPTAASVSKSNLPTPPAHLSEKLDSLKMRCSELGDKFDYETLERPASEYL